MITRQLGKDGPEVSAICFGAWPIGGGLGAVPEQQGIATVKAAIEVGMTFIDTAEGYQTSESVLGKALKGQRDKVFLATKLSGPEHSLEHMNRAVENSLRALGTDYIDLYQLHSPQPQWPIEDTMAGLLKLRDQGKIRYIGVSNFSAEETLEAMKYGPVHSSQPRYNMIWREAEESVLGCCLENGVGVIPHSVLAKGLLGGKHRPGHRFAPDDERTRFNFFQGETFEMIHRVTERLRSWAEDHGRDIVQLAIAWALANPAVTSPIVGAKSPEQVYQNAAAADWSLSAGDLAEIDGIMSGLTVAWIKD
ncbi:MAG: aldo/keto reductase [Chloroflexi bacterium]|nr:aldo/keto reductase [Chloroflexota bacterium]